MKKNSVIYQIPVTKDMKLPHIKDFFDHFSDKPTMYNLGCYCEYVDKLYVLATKIEKSIGLAAYFDVIAELKYAMNKCKTEK